jgi:two-component system copper resistance phosphate regulon response regulator CusR
MRLLIIEDDEKIGHFLEKGLKEEGFHIDLADNGEDGLYLAELYDYDVIILDILLPHMSGFEVCETFRDHGYITPIIMLTARDSITDKVTGLNVGADDYLTKPFSFEELLARIRVQVRKQKGSSNTLQIDSLTLDTYKREVKREGKVITLTAKEYALLEFMARNEGRIVTETIINENLTDMNESTMSNVINVYIYRLRNKIDKDYKTKLIHTIRGTGYVLGVRS